MSPSAFEQPRSKRSRPSYMYSPRAKKALIPVWIFCTLLMCCGAALAQVAPHRYALILQDPPLAAQFSSPDALRSTSAVTYRQRVEARQRMLRTELASRNIPVSGSVSTVLNAVFVMAPPESIDQLKKLPGVIGVVPERLRFPSLNRATQLVNAPAAWNILGGVQNSGRGIKIAILDSGIDQTHPAFQDSSLPMPAGYPLCSGGDCAFTTNKVIVARSYVHLIAAGSSPNPAADSRPDDYSPRDRDGHGTAVASCAAGNSATGTVSITGMAPKAYLGNYKISGSPTINDGSPDDAIIQAVEDAMKDGMDIISFSLGGSALIGPLDSGVACGNDPGVPCDLVAQTFENAIKAGMVIVASAGNDGQSGNIAPTFNTIESPADAPSVIAVGATTNSHYFLPAVIVSGGPSNLQQIAAQPSDSFGPIGALTAPLVDASQLGANNGLGCSAFPVGSLSGQFVLIQRGTCNLSTKLTNAENAGAIGVIFYMADQSTPISPTGLSSSSTQAVMVSNSDGLALKNFIDSNAGHTVTIDPAGVEHTSPNFNQISFFSSFGPSVGDFAIKPDLVAPGAVPPDGLYGGIYMAAERYDPLGGLFSSTGYAAADGTSFSTPIVAGAAALVKQRHPNFNSAQIKSALVNTASQSVTTDDSGNAVNITATGAGLLDAGAAVNSTVTVTPSSLTFGVLNTGSLPITKQLQIVNTGSGAVSLSVAVAATTQAAGTTLALDKQSLALAPNASGTVSLTISGSIPKAGVYAGALTLQASGVALRVPYLFLVGTGVAANLIPLVGDGFDGTVGQGIPDGIVAIKIIDVNGVPVANAPVTFTSRGATIQNADTVTSVLGIAVAEPILGAQPGSYSITAVGGGQRYTFTGSARVQPTVTAGSIVNAASFEANKPVAPGSYISIFGTGLSDFSDFATLESDGALPLAIDGAIVSFDVPSAQISVPAHLIYVSPGQVNVQVPWELQGQTAAQVKVTIDFSYGNVVSIPLSDFAPAFFEGTPGTAAALDANNRVVTSSNPARRGQVVQLFANGLGPVNNQPASGDPAPSSPLATTKSPATVTIGGLPASISFSGLAPGFAGLYQINAVVPAGVAPGTQPVVVTIGGQTSKVSTIPIQ